VDLKDGLDDAEKRKFLTLPVLKVQPLGCSARSQSLYPLRCSQSRPIGIISPGGTEESHDGRQAELLMFWSGFEPSTSRI
jgi:hypothetical protein